MNASQLFLDQLIIELSLKDKLHTKKIKDNMQYIAENFPLEFEELLALVYNYFIKLGRSVEDISSDYLKMISDMRKEGYYFLKNGTYRCSNQNIANAEVYSNPETMSYYMNALLVSQILWKHHFKIFMYFKNSLKDLSINTNALKILDIGPGHGFFSYIVKQEFPEYKKIDIVDISETSLSMTKKIIGLDNNKINYYLKDVFDYNEDEKYDLIVLGEVIEHLDNPKQILIKLSKLLNTNGVLWITAPTNAPALDHVYLFKTKEDIFDLIKMSNLRIRNTCNFFAEDLSEEMALKYKVTNLVGLFCENLEDEV